MSLVNDDICTQTEESRDWGNCQFDFQILQLFFTSKLLFTNPKYVVDILHTLHVEVFRHML